MTITPQAFLPFINKALDGMVGIAEVLGAVKALQAQIREDITHVQGDRPLGHPLDLHGHTQYHTQGEVLLH
jgi:hypothetical protein